VATYFDSSAILEVLLEGESREAVAECWEDASARVTSTLLGIEAITVLRRAGTQLRRAPNSSLMRARFTALETFLDGMAIHDVNRDVLETLRLTPSLSDCRSLDAVHLATALLFQRHFDQPLAMCTLDQRMRRIAGAHHLTVGPQG
jgi:predicted nucleic acid-binding protein